MNNVKRWRLFVAALLGMSFFVLPPSASAVETIDEVIVALNTNPIYVAEGIPGTTTDTAPKLASRLRDNDHLLIVMLPAPVGEEVSNDLLQTTLTKISDAFEGKKIIGLTIGTTAAAVGPTLPAGVATTLMTRANTVGTNPAEKLGTFIDNVHGWQLKNPEPVPPPPPAPPTPLYAQSWFWLLVGCVLGTLYFFGSRYLKWHRELVRRENGDIQFSSPRNVNVWIEKLLKLRMKVHEDDLAMRSAIMRLCLETEVYFEPMDYGFARSTDGIEPQLKWATDVVAMYLKLQNDPTHYRNVPQEKARRIKGIEQFADRMHDSVVDVRKHELEDEELDLMNLTHEERNA